MKREEEIEMLKWFWPFLGSIVITAEDKKKYFEWSERGKHKGDVKQSDFTDAFNHLVSAKQWRGRTIHELWEPGILDGSMPYFTLLGGYSNKKRWWQFWKSRHKPIPRSVVDFMKKEMFKGIDAEIIEKCYQQINHGQ